MPAFLALYPSPAALLDAAAVYRKAKGAVVTVTTDDATGTGFVVGNADLVVTAWHVVKSSGHTIRVDRTGSSAVRLVGYDAEADVALLRLSRPLKTKLALRKGAAPEPGAKVYAVGNPLGFLESTITEGIVSGKRRVGSVAWLQITAQVSHGSSGGPVLDGQGRVVGMVKGTIEEGQGLNFAVSAFDVARAIDRIKALDRGASEAADPAKVVVLGRLGQMRAAASIYTAPSPKAKLLSRAEKDMYIVVRPGKGRYATVVMKDGRLGYVSAHAVEVLDFEVTSEGAQPFKRGRKR